MLFYIIPFFFLSIHAGASAEEICLGCHADAELEMEREGAAVSLHVDEDVYLKSVHGDMECGDCHIGYDPEDIPHAKISKTVDCGACHADAVEEYESSAHNAARSHGANESPSCVNCHGKHDILPSRDSNSASYRLNIPVLCGKCHSEKGEATRSNGRGDLAVFFDYSTSVHGRGVAEKGLLPSAICSDCHQGHKVLKVDNPDSPVNRRNVSATCGTCHRGMLDRYMKGVHYSADEREMAKLPTCADCHSAHHITEVDKNLFMREVTHQCGTCHADLSETYLQTIHGKAYQLGYDKVARCSDCHDPHLALMVSNPDSSVGENNRLNTCRKCHPDATAGFAEYLTHATHTDREKYPALYYTYIAMTSLLVGVFAFFGIHTILWLPTALRERKKFRDIDKGDAPERYVIRFNLAERMTHLFVVLSFLLLALTGMMLKFSSMQWALVASKLMGGVEVAGAIHRFCAIITFGYFVYHFYYLLNKKRSSGRGWKYFLFEGDTLVPALSDLKDFMANIKWFLGLGPRPKFGRWTYWEKFDYLAVFWGVPVIGISGLVLWFPEFFGAFFPGWAINVAMIIHSDEALLAVGFIFTIHFFNTHLRPEAFPMDKVIFSGVVPEEKYREEREREYEELSASGKLEERVVTEGYRDWDGYIYAFGGIFLGTGIVLVLLIIYSMLFG